MMTTRHRLASAGPTKFHIQEILSATPCTLPSDPGERVKLLQRKLRTGNPMRVAEVVRDLAWRQRRGQASGRDVRLLGRAERKLVHWLATQTGEQQIWVRRRMWSTVERTISRFA